MKLRNKKTGQMGNFIINEDHFECTDLEFVPEYKTIAELNEEWEDYEEPKKHYEILAMGAVMEREDAEDEIFRNQGQREIGNYFETKEEAEKAVEKLKAWKRLKDKGFRFKGYTNDSGDLFSCQVIRFSLDNPFRRVSIEDLGLLFSQEAD